MNTFTGQKTKFKVKQPLLNLQLKDQSENQRAPLSLLPSTVFLKTTWLPRCEVQLQISRHVALSNISLWAMTGTCSCPGWQRQVRAWCSSWPSHPLCPCPCKHRCLGEAENHNCSQHWQQQHPCISAPTTGQGLSSSYCPFVLSYYKA